MKESKLKGWATARQIAECYGLSMDTIYKDRRGGKIVSIKLGNAYLIDEESAERHYGRSFECVICHKRLERKPVGRPPVYCDDPACRLEGAKLTRAAKANVTQTIEVDGEIV